MLQNKVEGKGHNSAQRIHSDVFPIADPIYCHLGMVSFVRVSQPGNQCKQRHRTGHAEICDHLSIVGKGVGNHTVEQAEHNHQRLPDGIAFGVEDQGGDPDEGGYEGEEAHAVEDEEEEDFCDGKCTDCGIPCAVREEE